MKLKINKQHFAAYYQNLVWLRVRVVNLLVCSTCIIFFHMMSWKGPEKSVNSV